MKRLSDSSLGGLMSMCPNATEEESNNPMYGRNFESMLEGLEEEESGHVSEKKRRLSVDQVKALEKNFEVENKLEPERKVKLAQELGLQPRQVAVWFQNRRARWKTKQLERDYGALKATYDALKLNFDELQHDNQSLHTQICELKSKLNADDGEEEEKAKLESKMAENVEGGKKDSASWPKLGEGSSDSDSSAILNEENQLAAAPQQLVKIEEHNFFGEESCSTLFSDDQPPSLHWYCTDHWD